jgi:hypothetical protein
MRRYDSELEAEYRDFEPSLPRIDLVIGVALSIAIGAGGLFGFGTIPGAVEAIRPQENTVAEALVPDVEPMSEFAVTEIDGATLLEVETTRGVAMELRAGVRAIRLFGCAEAVGIAPETAYWTFSRTESVPAL